MEFSPLPDKDVLRPSRASGLQKGGGVREGIRQALLYGSGGRVPPRSRYSSYRRRLLSPVNKPVHSAEANCCTSIEARRLHESQGVPASSAHRREESDHRRLGTPANTGGEIEVVVMVGNTPRHTAHVPPQFQLPRTLIARAATTTIVTSEIELSSIIIIFARDVRGMTSVALKAVAVEKARNR